MHKSSKTFIVQASSYIILLVFNIACGQNNMEAIKNRPLDKDLKVEPAISKIIDTIYTFNDGVRQLETVQLYELDKGILVSGHRLYYSKGSLSQTTTDKFDKNGNDIESSTTLHFNQTVRLYEKENDDYGNIVQLKATEGGRTNLIEYRNEYEKNKLVSVTVVSTKTGNVISKKAFKYDAAGNLIEEWISKLSLDAKNLYRYNDQNQKILHKHIRNGILNDSVVYHYDRGLLRKKEWFEGQDLGPMVTVYDYNKKNQLLTETEAQFSQRTVYGNHDALGNWGTKEQYSYGKISRLTCRTLIRK